MVALAPESVVEETPAAAQETVAAQEMSIEERKAQIITLVSDGKRDYFAAEYESASEKLGEAAKLSAEIFGDFASESFDANLFYGRTLLEIARGEEQILKTAMTDIPEGEEVNESVNEQVESVDNLSEEQKEEIKDQVDGALQENAEMLESDETAVEVEDDNADKTEDVTAGQSTAEKADESSAEQPIEDNTSSVDENAPEDTNEEDEKAADEEKDDMDVEDELTTMQTAWEILEVARNICDKQDDTEEWNLKKAEVLLTLGELSLEDENYKQAIDDLHMCLALHLKYRKSFDRAVSEVYITIARAHSLNDDYENAEKYYIRTRETLEGNLAALKEGESTDEILKDIASIEELIGEVAMKIDDAQQSGKQVEKEVNDIREKLGLSQTSITLQAKSDGPAGDITNLVRRKGEKRTAAGDAEEVAKKPKTEAEAT